MLNDIIELFELIFAVFMDEMKNIIGAALYSATVCGGLYLMGVFEEVESIEVVKVVLLVHVSILLHEENRLSKKITKFLRREEF